MPYSRKQLSERNLAFLPPEEERTPIKGILHTGGEPVILTDEERAEQIQSVQTGLKDALDEFFEDVFYANCGKNPDDVKIHLIKLLLVLVRLRKPSVILVKSVQNTNDEQTNLDLMGEKAKMVSIYNQHKV